LPVTPPVAVEPDPAATPPEVPAPTGGLEKKTLVRSSVPVVGTVSMQNPDSDSIVVECDLEGLSRSVIVFRWGKTEERLSPGVAMGRFKARVADVARLKNRKMEESRCFRRAVGYYVGLCRFYGRLLSEKTSTATENTKAVVEFLRLRGQEYQSFDHLNLLFVATELLQNNKMRFLPELDDFVTALLDRNGLLCETALFLDAERSRLLRGEIAENGPNLDELLDQYLTGLVYWLRRLAFLAHYRMVSIKDINLSYRMGSAATRFVHLYGELHGMYTPTDGLSEDWNTKTIEGFSHSTKACCCFAAKTWTNASNASATRTPTFPSLLW
jgi:hypothetical protein